MTAFFRRRNGSGSSTSSSSSSLAEDKHSILSSEIDPLPCSPSTTASTSKGPDVANKARESTCLAPPHSTTSQVATVPGQNGAIATTASKSDTGHLQRPPQDPLTEQILDTDNKGTAGQGHRQRMSATLSSWASFSSPNTLSFLTGEDPSIVAPVRGPAKLDFSTPAHPATQAVDFVITFLLVHYIQVFYSLVFLFIYLVRHGYRWPLVLAGLYLPSYFIPFQRLGGWPFRLLMRRPFWRCVQRTLAFKVEREVELSPATQYIFGWHPHGILLLSRFAIYGGLWEKLFPGVHFKTLAASPLFWIPPIREVSILLGGVDAGRASANRALRDGYSVSLYPGGSKEIYTTNPYTPETTLVLKIRKGFIRMALRYGCPLVPVYTFGEKYAYHRLGHATGFAHWLLAVLRVPFLIFWGRWRGRGGREGGENCVAVQVSVVVGKPLPVPKIEGEPAPEVVEEWLQRYCDEVQALFQRHKHKYARPEEFVAIS
ncbi:hypothetical protein NSK_000047 [Nannochloropsis salina CCMP1776]|uniref:Acyltransferase n=1 Tax=Nannochloropsis salina CCMP1776 TaxID=1027361 RepID=A0A4D9DEB2_9STRA|nr:hypothetical protein NSK_000047 [Nannochloropsis salina CCMP1776]|eukprot:TFJ88473.1 hypothetical protein NSK_000047 [Nannochloropsis salina CCMP1776]